MTTRTVYVVCGSTWPYQPTVHASKREASRRAAWVRRRIRAEYRLTGNCGVVIEPRNARDVLTRYPAPT